MPKSLLPYLDSRVAKFFLTFPLESRDSAISDKSPFPFRTVADSNPFSRIIEARIVSDFGAEVKNLFFLMQKDAYGAPPNLRGPLGNADIARSWQTAYAYYLEGSHDSQLILLADQTDPRGGLVMFEPLFYCRQERVFFHPPCPRCGAPLEECTDDALLARMGLAPYSSSLERFLYCSSCLSSGGESGFYAYELRASPDSSLVKDRRGLIEDYVESVKRGAEISGLPCFECLRKGLCGGSQGDAERAVVPFSFYPFHAFLLDTMSPHAADLLSFVSIASRESLESWLKLSRKAPAEPRRETFAAGKPRIKSENEKIYDVLSDIHATWRTRLFEDLGIEKETHPGETPVPAADFREAAVAGEKGGAEETLILSTDWSRADRGVKSPGESRQDEELQATRIIAPESVEETVRLAPDSVPRLDEGDELTETFILGREPVGKEPERVLPPVEEDSVPETVILAGGKRMMRPEERMDAASPPSDKDSASAEKEMPVKVKSLVEEEDFMSETVFISRSKPKTREGEEPE